MGQTWAVVAIGVSIGIALLLLFWSRGPSAPAAKPGAKPGAKPAAKKKEPSEEKAAAGSASTPAKTDAEPASTKSGPASGRSGPDSIKAAPAAAKAPATSAEGARARAQTVPEPAVQRSSVPSVVNLHPEDDDDITIVTLTPRLDLIAAALPDASSADEDDERGPPDSERASAVPIIYDADAAEDEPTRAHAVILVAAVGQTDLGQKRKINEDRYLALDQHNLYVVADGMGGHAGGEVASQLAVDVISQAFTEEKFEGAPYQNVPRRGSELALAIQMANRAIYERAKREPKLLGMGTTIVSARFTPGKERVYIGHVGDSRCYRFRSGQLTQITTDHTMGAIGMTGPFADHLSRAVGIAPAVKVDLVIVKPRHDDVFLLCSDGLSKMVKDDAIREILAAHEDPNEAINALVQRANEKGGRDNITAIIVLVKDPTGFARYVQTQQKKKRAAEAEAGGAAATDAGASSSAAQVTKASGGGAAPDAAAAAAPERVSNVPTPAPSVAARPSSPGRPSVPDARASSTEVKASQAAKAAEDASPEPPAERDSDPNGSSSKKRNKKKA